MEIGKKTLKLIPTVYKSVIQIRLILSITPKNEMFYFRQAKLISPILAISSRSSPVIQVLKQVIKHVISM